MMKKNENDGYSVEMLKEHFGEKIKKLKNEYFS
jgi:hypothetical protein